MPAIAVICRMSKAVIIPAAGSGSRFGSATPKQYLSLKATPLLVRTLSIFTQMPEVGPIIVAVSPSMLEQAKEMIEDYHPRRVIVCEGGTERQYSIASCLAHPALDSTDFVMVHDAVRPFATPALIRRLLNGAKSHGACIPGLPLSDTTKEIDEKGIVLHTHPRERLRRIQTPQVFRTSLLRDAYEFVNSKKILTTDDASVVEAFGQPVFVIDGDEHNFKITTQSDWDQAERIIDSGIVDAINLRFIGSH